MTITAKSVRKHIFQSLVIGTGGTIITFAIFCGDCIENPRETFLNGAVSFTFWILLTEGNSLISSYLDEKVSWAKFTIRRFFLQILGSLAYTVLAVYGLFKFFSFSMDINMHLESLLQHSVIITAIVLILVYGRHFLLNWRKLELSQVQLENENLSSKYETLKNQVNPHFLFNSLNTLSGLVNQDPKTANKFIKQLSDVYRYVLETKEKELVPLAEEMEFVRSFIFLQKIRSGEALAFKDELSVADEMGIAPLSVQMLVENAIKHNVVSQNRPLTIEVLLENNEYVVVKNNLQRKNFSNESTGVGLENIRARYGFLSRKKMIVEEDAEYFMVKLPIVKLQNDSNNHRG